MNLKFIGMQNTAMTISYHIGGSVAEDHFVEFFEQMAVIAKEDRNVNLVLEIDQIDVLRNLNTFFLNGGSKKIIRDNLRKFALITDADWIEELGDLIDFVSNGIEVKVFGRDEKEKANKWIQAATMKENLELETRLKQGYAHLLV
ncbi:STAS/SEC14 domain-containing protein [Flavobacteriaceae bacterium F89]|uniref:STAS/SEC14 domain-containing protein n=1 Tax=Cerina litoralis TaxID=2874477 RepID=A0AAE3JSC3_9FLAO|nr:STAS/SEC14 domain-containing protein [Cerina litoralis]MCG2462328.1 STAS/SEC14 domain-containing protein [Cerina litoralis]